MTVDTLRTFVETDLSESALQVILDAADEDLTSAIGPDIADVCTFDSVGDRYLFLARPAASITSITETVGSTVTTLAASDYKLWANKMQVERLATGTNPADGWCGRVEVSFAPGDLNRRNVALTQLVQLAVDYRPGGSRESIGDHSRDQASYDAEKARIIGAARSRGFA